MEFVNPKERRESAAEIKQIKKALIKKGILTDDEIKASK